MRVRTLFFFLCLSVVTGCSSTFGVVQWSGSGFLRKAFLEYKSVAILPFEGDDSGEVLEAFTHAFRERFPQISVVDRKTVVEAFQGQALNPGQLDEAARTKVGKTLGVQALITGRVYYPTILRWHLQVVIVDAETGRVMGRSLAEIDFMGALREKEGAELAVHKLTLQ